MATNMMGLAGKVMTKRATPATMPAPRSMFRGKAAGTTSMKPVAKRAMPATPATKPAMAAPRAKVKTRRSSMNTRMPY